MKSFLLKYLCVFFMIGMNFFTFHAYSYTSQARTFQKKQEETLRQLADTLEQLRAMPVKEYDSVIPEAIRPLFTKLKHNLRDLIFQTLNDQSFYWTNPEEVTSRLFETLKQHDISLNKPYGYDYAYDKVDEIKLSPVPSHPDLLVATTTLWVMCGSDTSFYLFQRVGKEWRLIAAQETNNYEDITGAQGAFQYAISPPDEQGQFFIVTRISIPGVLRIGKGFVITSFGLESTHISRLFYFKERKAFINGIIRFSLSQRNSN